MSNFCHDLPSTDHYGFGVHFVNLESINVRIVNFHIILKFILERYPSLYTPKNLKVVHHESKNDPTSVTLRLC